MLINAPPISDLPNINEEIIEARIRIVVKNEQRCQDEMEQMERQINELKQELRSTRKSKNAWKQKYLVAKGEKKIIRQVDLTRIMRMDSNLNRMVIEAMINCKNYYFGLRVKPEGLETCPINDKVIRLISLYLRSEYEIKETKLKKDFHFKEEPFY